MSHLHVTDGVLDLWVIIIANVVAFGLLCYTCFAMVKDNDKFYNNLAKLGVVSALMLITMSIPLGPIPAHLSLVLVAALLLGPNLGFISIVIVNLILALIGHGGITVLGLNSLIMGVELLIGFYLFSFMFNKISWRKAIAVSVAGALVVSVTLMVTTLVFAGQDVSEAFQSCSTCCNQLDTVSNEQGNGHSHGGIYLFLGTVGAGILLEILVVLAIVGYIRKVRPDYLVKGGS
ncbi:energy-coupling factor ABC transporter permease [Proteinivorax hydrogeniformans]|uniref:Energy-coupling factor ABC transporter permease n=1 Tax=Proteinivorax hydrogeniformans TaxID=1826727 RepID=A0AAU8HWE8_9FIRM